MNSLRSTRCILMTIGKVLGLQVVSRWLYGKSTMATGYVQGLPVVSERLYGKSEVCQW